MTHLEMGELYELYALGVLEPELAAEIDEHIRTGCSYCLEHVHEASQFTAALAGIAEAKKPPANLRERVLGRAVPMERRRNWAPAAAGLAAACVALLIFSLWARSGIGRMRGEISLLRSERNQLQAALEILSKSDTRSVQFGRAENVPHGRVFINPRGGLVFVGTHLPQLTAHRIFELWIVPRNGAPQAAGLFRPNAEGDSVHVSSLAVDPARTKALAVSIEPQEGSRAPTTQPIVTVPLG